MRAQSPVPETSASGPGLPDMKVSVRQLFGIDSDLEVPAFSKAETITFRISIPTICSIAT